MQKIINSSQIFDRGINSITYERLQSKMELPQRSNAPPPDIGMQAQVDQILHKPTFHTRLNACVKPSIENRELLLPTRFQQSLSDCMQQVNLALQGATEGSDSWRMLGRADRLLKDETFSQDMVHMYRSTLFRG